MFFYIFFYDFQFLDSCTKLLDLPFAARRLFDEKGTEHFNLQDLSRDQYVHVTCGEAWSDPTVTKTEQQRRFLLSQLTQDVSQIRQFCALRNPEGKLFLLLVIWCHNSVYHSSSMNFWP